MTIAPSEVFRYFAVDCSVDPTGDVVEVSPDQGAWTTAAWVTDQDKLAALALAPVKPPRPGLTRYWTQIFTGPDDYPLDAQASNTVYGRVHDAPEVPVFRWQFAVDL